MGDTTSSTIMPIGQAEGHPRKLIPVPLLATMVVSLVLGVLFIAAGAAFVLVAGLGGDPNPPRPGSWLEHERFTIVALLAPLIAGHLGILAGAVAVWLPRVASALLVVNGLLLAAFALRFFPLFWLAVALWLFLAYLSWKGADQRARERRSAPSEPASALPETPPWALPGSTSSVSAPAGQPPAADDHLGPQLDALRQRIDRRARAR